MSAQEAVERVKLAYTALEEAGSVFDKVLAEFLAAREAAIAQGFVVSPSGVYAGPFGVSVPGLEIEQRAVVFKQDPKPKDVKEAVDVAALEEIKP